MHASYRSSTVEALKPFRDTFPLSKRKSILSLVFKGRTHQRMNPKSGRLTTSFFPVKLTSARGRPLLCYEVIVPRRSSTQGDAAFRPSQPQQRSDARHCGPCKRNARNLEHFTSLDPRYLLLYSTLVATERSQVIVLVSEACIARYCTAFPRHENTITDVSPNRTSYRGAGARPVWRWCSISSGRQLHVQGMRQITAA